jgi:N-acetylglutamate synthase-like GNAT family acetyltransferase
VLIRTATDADLGPVRQLLAASGLPLDGVEQNFSDFIVAENENTIAGVIGIERYGTAGLLRSAVVSPGARGSGVGSQLVTKLLERASAQGIREVYLLTTTAEEYFPRFGFTRVTRTEVPESVQASREFQGACPDTAVVMKNALGSRGPF